MPWDLRIAAHLEGQALAQVAVQVRERLVEEQQLRAGGEGAGQRHALLLAPGKLVRVLRPRAGQADHRKQLRGPPPALGSRQGPQAEGHVVHGVEMREQRVVLEHHAHAALLGRDRESRAAHDLVAQADLAPVHRLETRHAAQGRGLAATAGAEEAADLALGQRQVEPFDHRGHSRVGEAQIPNLQGIGHENDYSLGSGKWLISRNTWQMERTMLRTCY